MFPKAVSSNVCCECQYISFFHTAKDVSNVDILRKLQAKTPTKKIPAASIVQSSEPIFFVIAQRAYVLIKMAIIPNGPTTAATIVKARARDRSCGTPAHNWLLTAPSSVIVRGYFERVDCKSLLAWSLKLHAPCTQVEIVNWRVAFWHDACGFESTSGVNCLMIQLNYKLITLVVAFSQTQDVAFSEQEDWCMRVTYSASRNQRDKIGYWVARLSSDTCW